MSIEWLKQYLLWEVLFFGIGAVIAVALFGVKYLMKIVKRKRRR